MCYGCSTFGSAQITSYDLTKLNTNSILEICSMTFPDLSTLYLIVTKGVQEAGHI